ncbi:MAG: M28 family peptidase, partial [Flavobacteriaceae bacterium]|nr:M28 family peptidase [Flavobacteriaceae bacterium]
AIWTRGNDKHSERGGKPLKVEDMKPHYLNDFIIDIFKQQGAFAHWTVNTNPFEGGSDHTPFLKANIPGLLLWHFTDQFYHTDNDRIDKVSSETMKNVGTAALVSAYRLINADHETAEQITQGILKAAKNRLNTEFALSQKAIADGKQVADEILILNTWFDWYFKTLASVKDLESKVNTVSKAEISKAQTDLEVLTKTLIERLKNTGSNN